MGEKIKKEKSIYILFFRTNTGIGKAIRALTKYKYNHVAIALDRNMDNMYAFARYRKNVPFVGGFTQESKLRYLEKDDVPVKMCKIDISKEKYTEIRKYINNIKKHSDEYMYNLFGAVTFLVHKKFEIPKAYICLEFIIHILTKFSIVPELKEDKFYTIKQLDKILEKYLVYEGSLKEIVKANTWGEDMYSDEEGLAEATKETILQVGKLINRKIFM